MAKDLIKLSDYGIAEQYDEVVLAGLSKSAEYLPQLIVPQGSSGLVKQGKFPIGHWCLYYARDKQVDLDEQFDCIVLANRPRASLMVKDDQPISYYTPESANFELIKTMSIDKKEQGYLAGLEYLLWIPSINEFALFFMGNTSLRRESGNVRSHLGKPITLKIKFVAYRKGDFHACEVIGCDTPLEPPPKDEAKRVYSEIFANPVDSEVNLAEDSGEPERAR